MFRLPGDSTRSVLEAESCDETMAVRVRQQDASATALAESLSTHRKVSAVHSPGLKAHPQHQLAREQMKGSEG
jgi:cystathionine beta-lyase/cystathionine gamma-synthase